MGKRKQKQETEKEQPVGETRPGTRQLRLDPDFLTKLDMLCRGLRIKPKDFVQSHLDPIIDAKMPGALEALGYRIQK